MKRVKSVVAALLAATTICLPGLAQASIVWHESSPGGAGDLLATAQSTIGGGVNSLNGISGALTASVPVGGDPLYQVDLYKISISDPTTFSARTTGDGFGGSTPRCSCSTPWALASS